MRVKVKSLAEESRIIRREIKKAPKEIKGKLRVHNVLVVRMEARATQLAIAFLRGLPRRHLEPVRRELDYYYGGKLLDRVKSMAKRYGRQVTDEQVERWMHKK